MRILLIILSIFCLRVSSNAQLHLKKKDVSCQGMNDGTLEAIVETIDGPFDYHWSNGATGKKITGLKPGDYTVTVSVNEDCMATRSGRIYDGPQFTVSISASLLDVNPKPLPCGQKPTFTYQLTGIPHGGKPPYYCSWGNLDPGDGQCSITVTGQSIRAGIVMADSSGCADSETWEKRGATKMCPKDPNDISGNDGYADLRWVSVHDELNYTVRFENDPIFATSSAGIVLVTTPIDDDVDPFSFRLTSMGFGDKIIEIPVNTAFYQQRMNYSTDLGFMVDITAGLDLPNNRFFWLFETIDPATGQPPTDPTAGFLPVNDTLTGSGEGFINFVCKPKPNTPTGEIVSQKAAIVFDVNDPIETNTWENKIDALPPATLVDPMPDTFYTNIIPFDWSIQDDPGGCGVQHAQIFLSTDRVEFESNGFIVDSTSGELELNWGTTYYFMILGSDNVNNREEGNIDSFYIIPQRSIEFITPDEDHYCIGDTLMIEVELVSIEDVDLYISIDSGETFTPLASDVSEWPFPLLLNSSHIHPFMFIKAVSVEANLLKVSDPFTVKNLPVIDAGLPVEGCDNEILFVEGTGANEYLWSPDSIIGNTTQRYSNVYADVSQFAYLRGTDVFGCSAVDSVYLTVHPHSRDTLSQPLCEGDSIYINGEWITDEGFYTTTYSNAESCDSIIVAEVQFQYPCIWNGGPFVYVDEDASGLNNGTTWTNAFNDLQDAIYVAGRYENVKEIWVAEGIYKPHTSRRDTSFVLRDSIKIFGGFLGFEVNRVERTANAALVQLSGDINVTDTLWDNSFHTVRMAAQCAECVIDGVTVTYGQADQGGSGNGIGAGVLNSGRGHFFNVIFERNYATDYGAALHSSGNSANLIIENCLFRMNNSTLGRDVMNIAGSQLEFRGANGMQ